MSNNPHSINLLLEPEDNERLRNVCGQLDEHLRQLETRLGIEINNRGNFFRIFGPGLDPGTRPDVSGSPRYRWARAQSRIWSRFCRKS